ncbi:MAG: phosphoglucosamine mutase [Isosphaeraceae bacterium]|jgi:phosphomannomutase|nr:MAG: phosphoglucosamine mutase [Isosphaeraceae bacterium]
MSSVRIASVSGLRGLVGQGLDPIVVVQFAAAYAAGQTAGPILVGHDARRSVAPFRQAVLAGLTASGRRVQDVGPVATPTLGVLVTSRRAAGAVQITASHNPPEYNGLKLFSAQGTVLGPEEGRAVLERIEREEFAWVGWDQVGDVGQLLDPDEDHLERVLAQVDVAAIRARRFRVVLDSAHGAGGRIGAELLRRLGCQITALGGVPDGLYEHPPEPTEANLLGFAALVKAVRADIGFAQDPDADRLAIVDETGRYLGEELTVTLAALHRLEQQPGPIAVNLSTTRLVDDVAAAYGGRVVRSPVGEYHVVRAMLESNAVLGGEGNGGVIDPRVVLVRDSLGGMAQVLDLLARRDQRLSEIVADLPAYSMIKTRVQVGPQELARAFDGMISRLGPERIDTRDGLRLDWPDRWIHVRASNTEPIARIIAEAPAEADAIDLAQRAERCLEDLH